MQPHSLHYLTRTVESALEAVAYPAFVLLALVLLLTLALELRAYVQRRLAGPRHGSRRPRRTGSARVAGC